MLHSFGIIEEEGLFVAYVTGPDLKLGTVAFEFLMVLDRSIVFLVAISLYFF